jgi:hypothetical protein
MGGEIKTDSKPSHDNAGYDKPPFASLMRGKQAKDSRYSNGGKTDWLSPAWEWRDEDTSEQNCANNTQLSGSRHAAAPAVDA